MQTQRLLPFLPPALVCGTLALAALSVSQLTFPQKVEEVLTLMKGISQLGGQAEVEQAEWGTPSRQALSPYFSFRVEQQTKS